MGDIGTAVLTRTTLPKEALGKFDIKYRGLRHFVWSPRENRVLVVVGYNPVRHWIAVVDLHAIPQSVANMLLDLVMSDKAQTADYLVGDLSILRQNKHPSGITWERFVLNEINSEVSRVAFHLDATSVVYSSSEQVDAWGIGQFVHAWNKDGTIREAVESPVASEPSHVADTDDRQVVADDSEPEEIGTGDLAGILKSLGETIRKMDERLEKLERAKPKTTTRRGRPKKTA